MEGFESIQEAYTASIASISSPQKFEQLIQREQAWENFMAEQGQERFRRGLQKNRESQTEAVSGPARKLLVQSLEPVTRGIQEFIDGASARRGPKHIALKIFEDLGADVAAYITGKVILDHISSKGNFTKMALRVAGTMVDELRFRRLKREHPHLFEWKMRKFNTSSYVHMKRSLDASLHFKQVDTSDIDLTDRDRLLVGTKAIDIFQATTQYVEIVHLSFVRKRDTKIRATEATLAWIERCASHQEFLAPVYMPTLIPPRPWSNTGNGGYWFRLAGEFPLIRTDDGRHQLEDLDNVDMPTVYTAVNALQETSWRINTRVLEVMQTLNSRGQDGTAGLPGSTKIEPPAKPADIDTNEVARKAWRTKAHEAHEREHDRVCRAIRFQKILATALILTQEQDDETNEPLPFYFPYSLDFRGRAYAIPLYLQPQGDDICRGLLQFGQGKPLGTLGAAAWLAIHGANCLAESPVDGTKLDKLPLQQRVDWIYDHNTDIQAIAEDPYSNDWWTRAENPFQFLAFCFEWAGYLQEGTSFVSYLPIAMDGSCNGLQHYSALLRDEVCGHAVNLIPSDQPQDIYRLVADQVNELLVRDSKQVFTTAAAGDGEGVERSPAQLALDWLQWGKVNRKFVKRQVMTLPYGSAQFGFRKQIKEFVEGLDATEQPPFITDDYDGFSHYTYIAAVIWEALQGTVVSACAGMEFFKALAKLCTKDNMPISWTAPNGLPVVQAYPEIYLKQIQTVLAGKIFQPAIEIADLEELDGRKQVQGIAPNVIHSLDAAAMMLTVEAAVLEEGITHFAMIHDSYGTHAADTVTLARLTREVFVRMYRDDVLGNIMRDMLAAADIASLDALPPLPPVGALDLTEVLQSQYFFA